MQQEVGFDMVYCPDPRLCGPVAEPLALIGIAVIVGLALHPRVLSGALKLVGEPEGAAKRMGIPPGQVWIYKAGLALLTVVALAWALAGFYDGSGRVALLDLSRPALGAVFALMFGATFGGLALLVSLAQHTLERRLGSGYASLFLGASAIGAALGLALMDSLHILSLIAGAIVGAAVISLYRAVDGLPWYAAATGWFLGALTAIRTFL